MGKIIYSKIFILLLLISLLIPTIFINISASPIDIYVYSPGSGNNYYEQETITISWSTSGSLDYVKIELYMNGDFYNTLSANTSNDGSYYWDIPSGYGTSYGYYNIKVTSLEDSSDYGVSGTFYIYQRSITVTYPSSGVTWYIGNTYTINWDSTNAGSYVKIQYSIGSFHYTITSSTYNDGSYSWYVSSSVPTTSNCKIKVISLSNYETYDYSSSFSIGQRTITVTKPTSSDTWFIGGSYQIKWTGQNTGSYVRIQYKSSIYSSYYTIVSTTENDGIYNWTIPSGFSSGANYQIKITSTTYSDIYDESDVFAIDERYIRVNTPNYNDRWYPNETHSIRWSSKNIGENVDIKLYKNGIYCLTIAENQNDSDLYNWNLPDILGTSNKYQIEVRSKSYNIIYGRSNEFSIEKRTITITAPESNTIWNSDESTVIRWESNNAGSFVEIELYKDGTYFSTISARENNYDNYRWRLDSNIPESSNYKIKITSLDYPEVYAYSNGNFTIEKTLLQTISTPFLIIFVIIVIIIISAGVIWTIKNKEIFSKKKQGKAPIEKKPIQNIQIRPSKMTPEEYENIWEK